VYLESGLVDKYIDEQAVSLPEKINFAFSQLPPQVEYINWLGDDDLLAPDAMRVALERIELPDKPVLVFGGCHYIDKNGNPLWNQRSGSWAVPLLRFGPQMIPQPASLYRRAVFERIGGLSRTFSMAFDFDLFLRLSKEGKSVYIPQTLASFRWHPGSLSVKNRSKSVSEASAVRKSHLPKLIRPISFLWEIPVKLATFWAGKALTRSLRNETS
jgi:GT2 family glycosyltransferase